MTRVVTEEVSGVRLVLSPVQMAAVMTHEDVGTQANVGNRVFDSLRLVGGVLELTGAGVLCLAPEPTMLSKAGCVIFGANGADNVVTGARQAWTGQDTRSLTDQGASKLAQMLGADAATAKNIGLAVDIAVPLAASGAVAAARIAAVRAGRISLAAHEASAAGGAGGHTILKHVGKTEQELRLRLAAEPRIPMASSFRDLKTAETAISRVLNSNAAQISAWAQRASPAPLKLEASIGSIVGLSVVRATGQAIRVTKVRVILKMQTFNGMPYYVLTAFPIP